MTVDIQRFFKEGRERGFTIQELKQHLLENGFDKETIEHALTDFIHNQENHEPEKKEPISVETELPAFENPHTTEHKDEHHTTEETPYSTPHKNEYHITEPNEYHIDPPHQKNTEFSLKEPWEQRTQHSEENQLTEPSEQKITNQESPTQLSNIPKQQEKESYEEDSWKKLHQDATTTPQSPLNEKTPLIGREWSGGRYIKAASIFGFILMTLSLFSLLTVFIPGLRTILQGQPIISGIILVLTAILFLLFTLGFVYIGRNISSTLISLASWTKITIALILFIVTAVSIFMIQSETLTEIPSENLLGPGPTAATSPVASLGIALTIIWVLLIIAFVTAEFLFAIGLIKARRKLPFALTTGILTLLFAILIVVILAFILYIVFNPFIIFALLFGGALVFITTTQILLYLLLITGYLFASLLLLKAKTPQQRIKEFKTAGSEAHRPIPHSLQ